MLRALMFFDGVVSFLVKAAFWIASLALLAIMVIGTADVIGTNIFGSPVPASLEIQEVLLVIIIFLGLGWAQQQREHIEVDLLTSLMSPSVRRKCELVVLLGITFVFALISMRSWSLAEISWDIGETANSIIPFPIYPGKFLAAAGASIAALESLRQIGRWFLDCHATPQAIHKE